MTNLILASGSEIRYKLLRQSGLKFTVVKSGVNERDIQVSDTKDLSLVLAKVKALDVANKNCGALVIGCDQTLEFDGKVIHKAKDITEAKQRLLQFSGKVHYLHSSLALAKDNEIIWDLTKTTTLKMRDLSESNIDNFLAKSGDILSSVGCYKIEDLGISLFEYIKGNYHDIMGLPLLELLCKLRTLGIDGLL